LFLLPFSSHCSTQNIGFSDSGYVIKPPQPSFAFYGAPPLTGQPGTAVGLLWRCKHQNLVPCERSLSMSSRSCLRILNHNDVTGVANIDILW